MSVSINNNYTGNIGRMFARQNVTSLYSAQKNTATQEVNRSRETGDTVSLSQFAPKPLTTSFLQEAMDAGKAMASGDDLNQSTEGRLREDRIFAAVTALALLGYDESQGKLAHWPGGFPAPTAEEIDVAKRRLSQRPYASDESADTETAQNDRLDLLERLGQRDTAQMTQL